MLPANDCFPTLVGEHSRLVRFRAARNPRRTWRFTTSGTLRRAVGECEGPFPPLDPSFGSRSLSAAVPLTPLSQSRIRAVPLSFFASTGTSKTAETGFAAPS